MGNTNIRVLQTQQIDDTTWQQIADGYRVCFDLNRTLKELKTSFTRSITGYSIHAMKFDENNNLMGHVYYQPRPYLLNGKNVICALSGGNFVLPEYRKDIFIFNDLVKALDNESKKLGWIGLLGVPNKNAFKYTVKINKRKYIGDLRYYILPVHAATCFKKKSRIIDVATSIYSRFNAACNKLITTLINPKEKIKPLHLNVSEVFLNIRFDWNFYHRVTHGNIDGIYRIYDEDGIKTAYILYFGEKRKRSAKSLSYVVNHILKNENVDAIMYVGTMNFPQTLLTKVPVRFVPQQLPLCVEAFNKEDGKCAEAFSDINNIDFGLINFDVR